MKLSIGELERLTGMSRTTLRYYDAEGLIQPERMENGYRKYTQQDLISLVQLKQLNAFGIELSELPRFNSDVTCKDIHDSLVRQEQSIEAEIEDLYQKLSRLRLHVDAYQQCQQQDCPVQEGRMIGAYRLFLSPSHAAHPATAAIFKRWMEAVPETYSAIRIPGSALFLPRDACCPADIGIGLLSGPFHRLNETLEEPIEYTPPCKCLGRMIRVKRLDRIPRDTLIPFEEYLEKNGLIPLGDFHGWIVYAPANHENDYFQVYLRLGIH